ncbi:unnamed protein product [Mytilus edulis]|uniref:Uncharacterized protein n=1 Tax=Mytilus edulis TaxID=6550 RepID=A0A8S3SH11_MYTED|nr:unnamed protein product [Mytilus edulis]
MNVLLFAFVITAVNAASYSDEKRLKEYLLANYSRGVKPKTNLSESLTIIVDLYLNSVIDFDVITGIMTIAGIFYISWEDEQIATRWNNSEFSDIAMTQFHVHEVWVPKLYIRNMAEETSIFQFSSTFDSESTYVTFFQNGTAMTSLVTVFHTTCTTDITHYPFDKHTCDISVIPRNLFSSLILETSVTSVLNEFTIENSEWSVCSAVQQDLLGPVSNVNFVVYLTRKPYFLVLNLVLPSIIICTVNSLSFLIPVESGERLSFCVSLLLTYIVFLTTVLDKLPSTDTVSCFNVYLFLQLIYSSFTVFGIIKTLEYYHYDCKKVVPVLYKKIVGYLHKIFCYVKVAPIKTIMVTTKSSNEDHSPLGDSQNVDEDKGNRQKRDMKDYDHTESSDNLYNGLHYTTWRDVADTLDRVLNIIAIIVALLNFIVFCIIMTELQNS